MNETRPINVADYERLAEACCEPGYWGYVASGAGDEITLRDNEEAFRRRVLRPRTLVDVSDVSTRTTVLDTEIALPLMVAPTSLQRVAHPDGEPGLARAAATVGTVYTLSSLGSVRPRELAETLGDDAPRWFQLYWSRDRGFVSELVAEAAAAGFTALVLTVDFPTAGLRERDLRSGFSLPADLQMPNLPRTLVGSEYFHDTLSEVVERSLTWHDLEWLRSQCSLPLVVKGILTAEDAALACEHGCAGMVVSNHGGRQLDGVSATLDALPEVVEAVGGRAEVYLDGGIRRGTDVAKALALGARAGFIGRPALWGLAAGGEDGARHVLEIFEAEIRLALLLLGCPTPADVRARARACARVIPLVSHRAFAELHPTGDHPERQERIRALHEAFPDFVEARPATVDEIAAVHELEYVETVRAVSADGQPTLLDPDTICTETTYEAALLAAGAAITAVELEGFALARPPGHHALAGRAMGFCIFNNVAVAARFAQRELGVAKLGILDWDVHHGNGTQDLFWDDGSVFFASIHRWPFYPGTGGPGEGNKTTLNVQLEAGAGDEEIVDAVEDVVAPALEAFAPDLLLVSAGFDAAEGDPLGGLRVTRNGFATLTARARSISERVAFVLEGGYNTQTLPGLVGSVLTAA